MLRESALPYLEPAIPSLTSRSRLAERTYTEQEITALLERATELQLQLARQDKDRPGLTITELEAVAAEAGIEPALLRQAAAELNEPGRSIFESSTGMTATHVLVERWIPGTLTPELWEDVVVELRHRFETDLGRMFGQPQYGKGSTEQIGRTVEWRHTTVSGIETRVLMRQKGDGIRVQLSQRVGLGSNLTEGIIYGTILSGILALMAGAFADSAQVGLMVLVPALLIAIPLITVVDRKWRVKKQRELESLADRIVGLAGAQARESESSSLISPPLETTIRDSTDEDVEPQRQSPRVRS